MSYTIAEYAQIIVYILLVVFWLVVWSRTGEVLKARKPIIDSTSYSQIQKAFRIVATTLVIDSIYWAIVNIARVVHKPLEEFLRHPWFVTSIKGLVLFSAIWFYRIVNRATEALREEREWINFSKFVELTWDAIGILDPSGRVVLWNAGAEKLFGFNREEVRGRDIRKFLVPDDLCKEVDEILGELRAKPRSHCRYNTVRLHSNGQRVPVDVTTSSIFDDQHKGYFGIMRKAIPLTVAEFDYFKLTHAPRYEEDYVFVVMPFSSEIVRPDVWNIAIKDAIYDNGLIPVRADEVKLTGRIMNQIFNDIRYARLVVADLTGMNPNVFYELGLAHVLNKPVIQLSADNSPLPFDIRDIRTIMYTPENLEDLRFQLKDTISEHLRTEDGRKVSPKVPE
ncbi:MAG: PAS domain S-box protein [Blastocatellia bacterium]